MRTVFDMLRAAEKIDIPYLVSLSLIDSQEEYVDLQKQQMMRGQRQDGKPIFNLKTGSDQYSPAYAKRKGKSSPIDLRDKGDFQDAIFITVEDPDKAIVDSADGKSGKLQENYGTAIFGLNDESRVGFAPIGQRNLLLEVEKVLG